MRLIDADALASALNNGRLEEQTGRAVPFNAGVAFALTMVEYFASTTVEYAPTADVAPVRHGRWINCEWIESGFKFVRCSECNHADMDSRLYKYCPWCGARMDEEADDE